MEILQITVGLLIVSAIVVFVSGSIDGECKQGMDSSSTHDE